jgi:hypothetical protein
VRPSDAKVELSVPSLLRAVDESSGFLPSYLEGKLTGSGATGGTLAIAVNGRIAAVTRTFRQSGETRFAALLPEASLVTGSNSVDVFRVLPAGPSLRLERLQGTDLSLALVDRGRGEAIESADGKTIAVRAKALDGTVRASRSGGTFVFSGWAADLEARRPSDSLVVFADGREIYSSRSANLRPHRVLGDDAPKKEYGFLFELPLALLPEPGSNRPVRVFAIRGGVAAELGYAETYPWPRR